MKKIKIYAACILLASMGMFGLSACASVVTLGPGYDTPKPLPMTLYSDVKYGTQAMNNEVGSKVGESCQAVVTLGFLVFPLDDPPTISNAATAGNINTIGSVSASFNSLLGIYNKHCIIVSGN